MSSSTGFVELEEKIASIYNSPAFSEAVFARENQHKKLEQSLDDLAQAQSNQIQTALDNISYRHHLKIQSALESLHSRHQTISESTLELIDRRSRQHNLAIERIANNPEFSRALEESATIANSVGEINRKHFPFRRKPTVFIPARSNVTTGHCLNLRESLLLLPHQFIYKKRARAVHLGRNSVSAYY